MLKLIKKYKKTVVGAHFVIFALVAFTVLSEGKEAGIFLTSKNKEININQTIQIKILIDSKIPINAASASISFPKDKLKILEIKKDNSIFDLWTEEPTVSKDFGVIRFGGGTFKKGGFSGRGLLLTIKAKALSEGKVKLKFEKANLLASDGKGTNILNKTNELEYTVYKNNSSFKKNIKIKEKMPKTISYDVNKDGKINMLDLSLMSVAVFQKYDKDFDLNRDGKVNFSDLSILITFIF